VFELVTK